MPRDYVKKEAPPRQRTPGWVWMLSGIALGLFIAFLFYLAALPPSTEGKQAIEELVKRPQANRAQPADQADPAAAETPEPQPEFDFYTILPEYEVAVPDEAIAKRAPAPDEAPSIAPAPQKAPSAAPAPQKTPPAAPAPAKAPPVAPAPEILEPGRYVIQVGSFRSGKDADRRKAQLALLGIVSTIQTVSINGSDTWHRVRIEPNGDTDRFNEIRSLLRDNEIEYMVLRRKG